MHKLQIVKLFFLVFIIPFIFISIVYASNQIVELNYEYDNNEGTIIVNVHYDVDNGNRELYGLGIRIHYDSSFIEYDHSNFYQPQKLISSQNSDDDTNNYDNDEKTNSYILMAWGSLQSNFPGTSVTLPLKLAELHFKIVNIHELTKINVVQTSGHDHYGFISKSIEIDLNFNCNLTSKLITDSSLLGYTATVGGATVTVLPFGITSVTNIYGEFFFDNIPYGNCILEIESSYFETITKNININEGINSLVPIQIYKPKCKSMYTQNEIDQIINQVKNEKESIIFEKEETIRQLSNSMASMYTQGYLDDAIIEAEKRGELKYDINQDGKVGLEEVIRYLETLSGVRVESLIIFPDNSD